VTRSFVPAELRPDYFLKMKVLTLDSSLAQKYHLFNLVVGSRQTSKMPAKCSRTDDSLPAVLDTAGNVVVHAVPVSDTQVSSYR
jgi:hypothetical protein